MMQVVYLCDASNSLLLGQQESQFDPVEGSHHADDWWYPSSRVIVLFYCTLCNSSFIADPVTLYVCTLLSRLAWVLIVWRRLVVDKAKQISRGDVDASTKIYLYRHQHQHRCIIICRSQSLWDLQVTKLTCHERMIPLMMPSHWWSRAWSSPAATVTSVVFVTDKMSMQVFLMS